MSLSFFQQVTQTLQRLTQELEEDRLRLMNIKKRLMVGKDEREMVEIRKSLGV